MNSTRENKLSIHFCDSSINRIREENFTDFEYNLSQFDLKKTKKISESDIIFFSVFSNNSFYIEQMEKQLLRSRKNQNLLI